MTTGRPTCTMPSTASWSVRLGVDAFGAVEPQIDKFLIDQTVDSRAAYVTRLVIEEIVRNLIEHTPPYASDEEVSVQIDVESAVVRVVIEDARPPFNPVDAPRLDVDAPLGARRAGGMGLHLVRNLTDELTYERDGDRNRLTAAVARG